MRRTKIIESALRHAAEVTGNKAPAECKKSRQETVREYKAGFFSESSEAHPHENQDAFLCNSKNGYFGVFDGMGGHKGGITRNSTGVNHDKDLQ